MGSDTNYSKRKKSNKVLLILAAIFMLAGIILLSVEPIKNYLRQKKVDEFVGQIESKINSDDLSNMTFVVPVTGNEVNGEDYDYFSSDGANGLSVEEQLALMGSEVTLNGIAIIEINSIDLKLPVWDTADVVTLRYGVGHYEASAKPGEEGNCTILGHHMKAYGSMFNRLGEVEIGDAIKIKTIEGNNYTYIVDNIIVVSPFDLINYIQADSQSGTALTLVTCTYSGEEKFRLLVIGHLAE